MEQTITGLQSNGIQSCGKHWILNEQETQRNPSFINGSTIVQEAVSTQVDDRTMHELYMWPFVNAVKAGVSSIMCSYQRINGSYACQNSMSNNGLLKGEVGNSSNLLRFRFSLTSSSLASKVMSCRIGVPRIAE